LLSSRQDIANASHAARFRSRNNQRRFTYGETVIASMSKAAPTYSESPDAKYKPTGFIAEILSAAGCEPALSVVEGDLARDAYLDMLPSRTPDASLKARDDASVVETQRAGSKLHRFMAE
jgi:hypothetical protein